MRFLIDMNLTPRWVQHLKDGGHDCIHWSEIGSPAASDLEICAYARQHECVLITNDLDFPHILAHTRDAKPSVILMRGEPLTPEHRSIALLSAVADCAGTLRAGAILTLDWSDKPRARLLPLK